MSLISVLIAAAIGGVLITVFSTFFVGIFKQQQGVTFRNEVDSLSEEIRGLLSSSQSCKNSFLGLPLSAGMNHNINDIKDGMPAPGAVRYDKTTIYGERTIQISNMRLNNYRPAVDRSGDATFVVEFTNQGKGTHSVIGRAIEIRTESDASGNLESCVATSKMSDGLWRRSMVNINNIFYTAPATGGNVGIGLSEPLFKLHIDSGMLGVTGAEEEALIHDDGGLELYRSSSAVPSPSIKGYVDFKNDRADDYDARLEYEDGVGLIFRHTMATGAVGDDSNASFTSFNGGAQIANRAEQGHLVISGVGDGPETYSALYLTSMTNSGDPGILPRTDDSWVLAFKKNPPPGGMANNFQIARWSGGSMSSYFAIRDNGNVGIGHSIPTSKLHVNGNFRVRDESVLDNRLTVNGEITATGTISAPVHLATSDERLKKNIQVITERIMPLLKDLEPVSFNWRSFENKKEQLGFVAQKVESIFPSIVVTSEKGFKSIDYNGLVALLIKGFQELVEINNKYESENEKMKERLETLEVRIQKLENKLNGKN